MSYSLKRYEYFKFSSKDIVMCMTIKYRRFYFSSIEISVKK